MSGRISPRQLFARFMNLSISESKIISIASYFKTFPPPFSEKGDEATTASSFAYSDLCFSKLCSQM